MRSRTRRHLPAHLLVTMMVHLGMSIPLVCLNPNAGFPLHFLCLQCIYRQPACPFFGAAQACVLLTFRGFSN